MADDKRPKLYIKPRSLPNCQRDGHQVVAVTKTWARCRHCMFEMRLVK